MLDVVVVGRFSGKKSKPVLSREKSSVIGNFGTEYTEFKVAGRWRWSGDTKSVAVRIVGVVEGGRGLRGGVVNGGEHMEAVERTGTRSPVHRGMKVYGEGCETGESGNDHWSTLQYSFDGDSRLIRSECPAR